MIKVISEEERIRRLVEGSINTFITKGKMSHNWVISEIRTSGIKKEALRKLFSESYARNPNNVQLRELEKECKERGFL